MVSSSTAPSSSSLTSMEKSLQQVLEELQVRSQVEGTIRGMVQDVEWACQLEQQVHMHQERQQWQQQWNWHQQAWEEAILLQRREQEQRQIWADALVKELWHASQKLGELKDLKEKHQQLLETHDSVVAQMLQAQEDLQELRERGNARAAETNAPASDPSHATPMIDSSALHSASDSIQPPPSLAKTTTIDNNQNIMAPSVFIDPPRTQQASGDSTTEGGKQAVSSIITSNNTPPVVALDDDRKPAAQSTSAPSSGTMVVLPPLHTPSLSAASSVAEPATGATMVALPPTPTPADTTAPAASAAVVSLEEETTPEIPSLSELDSAILTNIFTYLDALDILNTAQINVSMYSRVDTLFGMGQADEDTSTIATADSAPPTRPPTATGSTEIPTTTMLRTATSGASSTFSTSSTPKATTGTTSSIPSAGPPATATSATTTTTTTTAAETITNAASTSTWPRRDTLAKGPMGVASLFGQLLQHRPGAGRGTPAPTISAAPPTTTTATAASSSSSSKTPLTSPSRRSNVEGPPMNAALANSMAAKLSDAELNAIIAMTERLRHKEALAEKWAAEKEDLVARMEAAEALKDYLLAQVQTMHTALATSEQATAKVSQQMASDQEVIAFLDGRVQSLEEELQQAKSMQTEMLDELAKKKLKFEERTLVMNDMLAYERDKYTESEREWKATKKVLIKEVKHSRSLIAALEAERDGYREQYDKLRQSILNPR
jgi:hypothetical protein